MQLPFESEPAFLVGPSLEIQAASGVPHDAPDCCDNRPRWITRHNSACQLSFLCARRMEVERELLLIPDFKLLDLHLLRAADVELSGTQQELEFALRIRFPVVDLRRLNPAILKLLARLWEAN